ncbi:hypothetical protein EV361DRAFT_1007328, partial [Lentinula raphanica]
MIILGWYPETNTDDACSVKQLPGVDQPSLHTSPSQSIPPRPPARSNTPLFIVTGANGANGQTTRLPTGFCVPLMFIARFQWLSLELVLWEEYKFSILHVSRLCSPLLKPAQDVARVTQDGLSKGMDRKWRCATFDRALTRYRLRWFISNPSQVEAFFTTFSEEQFTRDAIRFAQFSLFLIFVFFLSDNEEITNGLRVNDDWFWDTPAARVEGGTDAWSLMTLAQSSSTPASELPSTYSQSAVSEGPNDLPSESEAAIEGKQIKEIPNEKKTGAHERQSCQTKEIV